MASLCLAFFNVAEADSLDTLLNDVNKRISIVEKTGICQHSENNTNPEHNTNGCEIVIAKCPINTQIVPELSKCDFLNQENQKVKGWSMSNDNEKTNTKDGQQECQGFDFFYPDVANEYSVKATAACAKIPKAVPTILKRFGVRPPQ